VLSNSIVDFMMPMSESQVYRNFVSAETVPPTI